MQQSQENNRRLLRSALPNLAPGYGDSAHDKAAERIARDMEPGFTPGPWRVGSHSDTDIGIIAPNSEHGGQMVAMAVIDEDVAQDEDEHLANARLVAAAPDLYAALGAIESYLTSHLVIGKNGKASTEVANMLDAARAALARAKGGAA